MERIRMNDNAGGRYFEKPPTISCIPTGCRLLDRVLGGGFAEGRFSNVVGDKCLSGDTIVCVKRGSRPKKLTLRTLFSRVNGNHFNKRKNLDTYMLSDLGGHVGMGKVLAVVKSGEKEVYEVVAENGFVLKATRDHKFKTETGWRTIKGGMKVGDRVHCWRGTREVATSSENRKDRKYTYSVPYHPYGLKNFVAGRDYKRILTARLVVEAAMNGVSVERLISILRNDPEGAARFQYISPGMDVHHLDGDPTNDALENLQVVDPELHWRIHSKEMPVNCKRTELSKIKSIRKIGRETTYDVTMEGPHHNFIANGFVVHNSTGKTLLCIEACANFALKYPDPKKAFIRYAEAEAAFDQPYAEAVGLPLNRVQFNKVGETIDTVEAWHRDLNAFLTECEKKKARAGLYILDSLDSIGDEDEKENVFGKDSYGAKKPKLIGQLFRREVRRIQKLNVTLIIVSQIRDKIGVSFGDRHTRSGGKALDFYASQIIWLANKGQIEETKQGVKRKVGVCIGIKCKKNKVGLSFRECDIVIRYGFGVDSFESCLQWLLEVKMIDRMKLSKEGVKEYLKSLDKMTRAGVEKEQVRLNGVVDRAWMEIEKRFLPVRRKYL